MEREGGIGPPPPGWNSDVLMIVFTLAFNHTYLPFVRIKKRNIETMFATARPDNLSALGPNGSGRGPARPYNAEASKATQTANTAHNGSQITLSCSTMSCRAEPVEPAARRRSNGVANRRSSIAAKVGRRNMLACG